MTIFLYNNSSEPNRVDKQITIVEMVEGALRDESSLTNLSVEIELSENTLPSFNYAYIPDFKRYFFIDDIMSVRSYLWRLSLSIDVLMTYKDKIRSLTAFISRNEFTYNPDIVDNSFPMKMGYDFEAIQGSTTAFEDVDYNNSYCCVLSGLCGKSALAP